MVRKAKAYVADRAAGQAALNAKPALLQTNLELGRIRLQRLEESKAVDDRRAALQDEGSI
jgi:hypothetical protein